MTFFPLVWKAMLNFYWIKETQFIWVSICYARKYKRTQFFHLLVQKKTPFYVVIRSTRRFSRLQGKGCTFISHIFWALSIGPAPGNEPATSRSLDKCSCRDWASPAAVCGPLKKANTNSVHTSASYQFSVGRARSPTDYAIVCGENNTRFAVEKKTHKLRLIIWPMARIKTCSRGVTQKIACITGALWTKRGKHGILREARNKRTARD